jgi:hypothetical protein
MSVKFQGQNCQKKHVLADLVIHLKDRNQKIRLADNKLAYKKKKDDYKLEDRYLKKRDNSQSKIHKIEDKKTAHNEVHLH